MPKWLDEANGTISAVRTEEASKLCCQIGAQAYFDRDSLSVEMVRYFHDHDSPMDPFADDSPVGVPPRLIKEIGFISYERAVPGTRFLHGGVSFSGVRCK